MKITKRQLRKIIKEELNLIFEGEETPESQAEGDGWRDYNERTDKRAKKWENTRYWDDYNLGYENAEEAEEYSRFQDEEYD